MSKSDKLKSELDSIMAEVAQVKNLRSYEVNMDVTLQVGDGFVAHFYIADIVDKESKKVTKVAIKKASGIDFNFGPLFKNETIFYNTTYPALQKLQDGYKLTKRFDNVPVLLSSGLKPANEYMVMENLKTQGYVLFPKEKYWDPEHLQFIFDVYGRFHAASFVLKKKDYKTFKKVNEEFAFVYDMFMEHIAKIFEECIKTSVNALDPESAVYDYMKDLVTNVIPTVEKSIRYKGKYSCSTHGDCWSNNMMFKYSESGKLIDMKLIDFQLSRENTPIHDLSYFFYSGASKTDLDKLEDYLKIYHNSFARMVQELGEDVEEILPYSTLVSEWKENALFGLLIGLYLWQIKLVPKENYSEDLKQASDEGGNFESMTKIFEKLMRTVQSDAYTERTTALLTHVYEFGVVCKDGEECFPSESNVIDTHL